MALGSCYTGIRFLLFGFNFIFWLLGCAILGVGIWLRVDEGATNFVALSEKLDVLYTVAYVMMAVGFVMMLIGFLGCCGAIRESQCMLATFFLFLFIIFAVLLGFGIWVVVAKGSFKNMAEDAVKDGVDGYYDKEVSKAFMDALQRYLHCCGATRGEIDYVTPDKIPGSCYLDSYRKPCSIALTEWTEDKLVIGAGLSIGIAVILILGMVFSIVLCCALRDSRA